MTLPTARRVFVNQTLATPDIRPDALPDLQALIQAEPVILHIATLVPPVVTVDASRTVAIQDVRGALFRSQVTLFCYDVTGL